MDMASKDAVIELLQAFNVSKDDIARVLGVEKISDYPGPTEHATAKLLVDAIDEFSGNAAEVADIQLTVNILGYPCTLTGNNRQSLLAAYAQATAVLLLMTTGNMARFMAANQNPNYPPAPVPPIGNPPTIPPTPVPTQGPGNYPPSPNPSVSIPAQTPPVHSAPPEARDGEVKTGIDPLHEITVNEKGHVKFKVGRWKWPFTDARGAEAVAELFDQELGWQPEHFSPMRHYGAEHCGGLFVQWEKPDKYFNVTRVFKKI